MAPPPAAGNAGAKPLVGTAAFHYNPAKTHFY